MKYLFIACLFIQPAQHTITTLYRHTYITEAAQKDTTLQGRSQLMPVLASDTASGKIPYIIFDLKTKKFSGNTGCNSMSGGFLTKQDALSFAENIVSTKMACQGYNEKIFFHNLLKTNRYVIKDGVLQLMYDATVLSKWVRFADAASIKEI